LLVGRSQVTTLRPDKLKWSAKAGAASMKFLPGFLLDALLKIND
jgi:hypothetical protein